MKKLAMSLLLALAAAPFAGAQSSGTQSSGAPGSDALVSSSPLIVAATYNIRMNTPRDGVNAWPNRAAWVRELVRFHEWDIFGTQEGFREQLDDLLQMEEYAQIGVGRDDGADKGEHSAIFYRRDRFELLDKGDFWLSETPDRPGAGWDAQIFRICSWGKFRDKFGGREFFFFSAHFDHIGVQARVESSKLIVKKIAEITGGAPTILVGDMNSTPDSDAYAVLAASLRDSYKVTENPPYGPEATFNSFDWDRDPAGDGRIDYLFSTEGVRVLRYGVLTDSKDKRYPSDHFPVEIKLTLR
ncbi:MAG: endonuclease/exonuclease/phosphatase family protein [Alistipes sp.]|jgi:endonuclease/exonuclease/phosphatase family metal-dependent hydrolase|nr:endonuclease/exonuclease/phosphatase family protein [Alistipes sp.]